MPLGPVLLGASTVKCLWVQVESCFVGWGNVSSSKGYVASCPVWCRAGTVQYGKVLCSKSSVMWSLVLVTLRPESWAR